MGNDEPNQGIGVVVDTLLLIGFDHVTDVRGYVHSKLELYRPELVSLEYDLNLFDNYGNLSPGPRKVKTKRFSSRDVLYLDDEEIAYFDCEHGIGIDYALGERIPLFFIDRIIKNRDAIFGLHNNNLIKLDIPYDDSVQETSQDPFLTGRNRFVKNAYDILVPMYQPKTAAHICGRNHLDEQKGIPLQEMIKAGRYIIIDAVRQEEKVIPGTDLRQ